MLGGKANDGVAESDRLARMPYVAAAVMLADPPAESVLNARIVGLRLRHERLIEFACVEPCDPMHEGIDRCVDSAVASHRAPFALIGAAPDAIVVTVSI